MTVSSGGFELSGNDGDETRLVRHPHFEYSIAIPGRPRLAAARLDGPSYDIVVEATDVPIQIGLRIDEDAKGQTEKEIVAAALASYHDGRARIADTKPPAPLLGRALTRGAGFGMRMNYELAGDAERAMEFLAVVAKKRSERTTFVLYLTVRYHRGDVTPFVWSNFRAALLWHQSWVPWMPASPDVWPESSFLQRSARFLLTEEALRRARTQAEQVSALTAEQVDKIASYLIEATNLEIAPAAAWPDHYGDDVIDAIERAVPRNVSRVLLADFDQVRTGHDYRGWLWSCYLAIGNRPDQSDGRVLGIPRFVAAGPALPAHRQPDLDAAYDAVVAAPLSDEARLVYADTLDASDPDRAELIYLQVDLARRLRNGESPTTLQGHFARVQALLETRRALWTHGVRSVPGVEGAELIRGCVEWVRLSAQSFLDYGPRIYSMAPILHADLVSVKSVVKQLASCSALTQLHSLSLLGDDLTHEDIETLTSSPHLRNLSWLDLGDNVVDAELVAKLATSGHLPCLQHVKFDRGQQSWTSPALSTPPARATI